MFWCNEVWPIVLHVTNGCYLAGKGSTQRKNVYIATAPSEKCCHEGKQQSTLAILWNLGIKIFAVVNSLLETYLGGKGSLQEFSVVRLFRTSSNLIEPHQTLAKYSLLMLYSSLKRFGRVKQHSNLFTACSRSREKGLIRVRLIQTSPNLCTVWAISRESGLIVVRLMNPCTAWASSKESGLIKVRLNWTSLNCCTAWASSRESIWSWFDSFESLWISAQSEKAAVSVVWSWLSRTTIRSHQLLLAQSVHLFGEVRRGLNELNPN